MRNEICDIQLEVLYIKHFPGQALWNNFNETLNQDYYIEYEYH